MGKTQRNLKYHTVITHQLLILCCSMDIAFVKTQTHPTCSEWAATFGEVCADIDPTLNPIGKLQPCTDTVRPVALCLLPLCLEGNSPIANALSCIPGVVTEGSVWRECTASCYLALFTLAPTSSPTMTPTFAPSVSPSISPTLLPSASPSMSPSTSPSVSPSTYPTTAPTVGPTISPSNSPSVSPTGSPTLSPSMSPSFCPSTSPSTSPSTTPTTSPSKGPTLAPEQCSVATELVFVLDRSESITLADSNNWGVIQNFVIGTLQYMPVGTPLHKVAVVTFSGTPANSNDLDAQTRIPLSSSIPRDTVYSQVNDIPEPEQYSRTFMDDGFREVLNMWPANNCSTAIRSMVLITDGQWSDGHDPRSIVQQLLNCSCSKCPYLLIISIGEARNFFTNDPDGIGLASLARDVVNITSVANLANLTGEATAKQICQTEAPSQSPSLSPTASPSQSPSLSPTTSPSVTPSISPSMSPSVPPSSSPSSSPSFSPTASPSQSPSLSPTMSPSASPSISPSMSPSVAPSTSPSSSPSLSPSQTPTLGPSQSPTITPTLSPTHSPTTSPTISPSSSPTIYPSLSPSKSPTLSPSSSPSHSPSSSPTLGPTVAPTTSPSQSPSTSPTRFPSVSPTSSPTRSPSGSSPTAQPSNIPTTSPTKSPSLSPTLTPSISPSVDPTISPSHSPTTTPSTSPSVSPTNSPSLSPTISPSQGPTMSPSISPSFFPSQSPSMSPSFPPTNAPSILPSTSPTNNPTTHPTRSPTLVPSPQRCERQMELIYLLDRSESIILPPNSPDNFGIIKDFVIGTLDYFHVGTSLLRQAVVTFSGSNFIQRPPAEIQIPLTSTTSRSDLVTEIRGIPGPNTFSHTFMDEGFALVESIWPTGQVCSDSVRVILLITDGRWSTGHDPRSIAGQLIQSCGCPRCALLFIISMGEESTDFFLGSEEGRDLASLAEEVIPIDSVQSLANLTGETVAQRICTTDRPTAAPSQKPTYTPSGIPTTMTPTKTPTNIPTTLRPTRFPSLAPTTLSPTDSPTPFTQCLLPLDVVFLIDESQTVLDLFGEVAFSRVVTRFVFALVEYLDIGLATAQAQVSVVTFGTAATTAIRFEDAENKSVFSTRFSSVRFGGGITNLAAGLAEARNVFSNPPGRVGVAGGQTTPVLITITDAFYSNEEEAVLQELHNLDSFDSNLRRFSISPGRRRSQTNYTMMTILASKRKHVHTPATRTNMLARVSTIARDMCPYCVPDAEPLACAQQEENCFLPEVRQVCSTTCCETNPTPTISPTEASPCPYAIDLIILLDFSESTLRLTNVTRKRMVDFAIALAGRFRLGPDTQHARVAVAYYGINTTLLIPLDGRPFHQFETALKEFSVEATSIQGSLTYTSEALSYVQSNVVGFERDAETTLLVVTDGHATPGHEPDLISQAIELENSTNIITAAVGTHDEWSIDGLTSLTRDPQEIFELSLTAERIDEIFRTICSPCRRDLSGINCTQMIADTGCTESTRESCSSSCCENTGAPSIPWPLSQSPSVSPTLWTCTSTDMIIALDTSAFAREYLISYQNLAKYVTQRAGSQRNSGGGRISVIGFAEAATVHISLLSSFSDSEVHSVIDNMQTIGGTSSPDVGLNMVRREFALVDNPRRRASVIFTTAESILNSSSNIREEIAALQLSGVFVFVVALGAEPSFLQIAALIGDQAFVHVAQNVSELESLSEAIALDMCELKGQCPGFPTSQLCERTSTRKCDSLRSARCPENNKPVWRFRAGQRQICAASLMNCSCKVSDTTFVIASNICESEGARLCTRYEVGSGRAAGTGCSIDSRLIWTSTKCERDGVEGRYTLVGAGAQLMSNSNAFCETDLNSLHSVRCCADARATTVAPVQEPTVAPTDMPQCPSSCRVASVLSCGQLAAEPVGSISWGANVRVKSITLSDSSGLNTTVVVCAKSHVFNNHRDCTEPVSLETAIHVCSSEGARLCSAAELEAGAAKGSGCGLDSRWVWSGSPCTVSGNDCTSKISLGAGLGQSGQASRCANATELAYVRCCADANTPLPSSKQTCSHITSSAFVATTVQNPAVSLNTGHSLGCVANDVDGRCSDVGYRPPRMSHVNAVGLCSNIGGRLCTRGELESGFTSGYGCGLDFRMIWTSSTCTNWIAGNLTWGYYATPGRPDPNRASECITDLTHINKWVRCCGDTEKSTAYQRKRLLSGCLGIAANRGDMVLRDYSSSFEPLTEDQPDAEENQVATWLVILACSLITVTSGMFLSIRNWHHTLYESSSDKLHT